MKLCYSSSLNVFFLLLDVEKHYKKHLSPTGNLTA